MACCVYSCECICCFLQRTTRTVVVCVFPGVFLSSRVTGACSVTTDLIMRVNVRTTTTTTTTTDISLQTARCAANSSLEGVLDIRIKCQVKALRVFFWSFLCFLLFVSKIKKDAGPKTVSASLEIPYFPRMFSACRRPIMYIYIIHQVYSSTQHM